MPPPAMRPTGHPCRTSVNVQMKSRSSRVKAGMFGGRKFSSSDSTPQLMLLLVPQVLPPPPPLSCCWLGRRFSLPATVTETASM
jgi:hypothetical protein